MTSHPRQELEARLALAETIAREAGAKALDYFKRRETLVIETKRDPQDVVSIADRDVEQLIRSRVSETFSQDGFLGEEYGLNEGSSGYTWVVDPIDGTSPFVNGMPNWCVSIAVLKDGEPVIGVIQAPCFDELLCFGQRPWRNTRWQDAGARFEPHYPQFGDRYRCQ